MTTLTLDGLTITTLEEQHAANLGYALAPLTKMGGKSVQQRGLEWLRDHVNTSIPHWYYSAVLGHDIHLSVYATLRIRKFDNELGLWVHPYKKLWCPTNEYAPIVSRQKVTTAFRDDIVDVLTNAATPYADFNDYKFHELGTANTAEANTQTALDTSTGIARVTGTQVENASNIYESVATTTMDASENILEHGLFNNSSGATMMDRSIFSAIAVVSSDLVQSTYDLTVNAEA